MSSAYRAKRHLPVAPSALGLEMASHRRVLKYTCGGPSSGYGAPEKGEWRTAFWARIAARCGSRASRAGLSVFMLEALEGLEIEKALRLGFSESRLHVCNANPAVVATLKRRYPQIHTYGVTAERALVRIAETGSKLDVLSLDFCACLSPSVLATIQAARSVIDGYALVGVNVLRGREPERIRTALAGMSDAKTVGYRMGAIEKADTRRLVMIQSTLAFEADESGVVYVTTESETLWRARGVVVRSFVDSAAVHHSHVGSLTMLWCVLAATNHLNATEDGQRGRWVNQQASRGAVLQAPDRKALGDRR